MFVLFISVLLFGLIYASVMAIRKWGRYWRLLASVPLFAMAIVMLKIIVDTNNNPTSHNLWPFEILFYSVGGLAYLAIVFILRWLIERFIISRQ